MKRGFTILELLVASLLLAMLVTMLSMMFNQSSIAWRTGVAGVVELNRTREVIGTTHDIEDEVLPGLGDKSVKNGSSRTIKYRTVSLWKENSDNQLRTGQRAFDTIVWNRATHFTISDAEKGTATSISGASAGTSAGAVIVGVRSWGPDGKPETGDDITNWPEEVE